MTTYCQCGRQILDHGETQCFTCRLAAEGRLVGFEEEDDRLEWDREKPMDNIPGPEDF